MVSIRTTESTCDRCSFGKVLPATTSRTYAIEDRYYKLDLCENHGEMFDRDIGGWTRLSEEIDNPYDGSSKITSTFTREQSERARAVLNQSDAIRRNVEDSAFVQKQAEKLAKEAMQHAYNSIPGAKLWTFTNHARERMMLRKFTPAEVLMAVTMPATRTPHPSDPSEVYCTRDRCIAIVNPRAHVIVTILDRDLVGLGQEEEDSSTAASTHPQQELRNEA